MKLKTVTLLVSTAKDKIEFRTFKNISEIQKVGSNSFSLSGLFPKASSIGYNLFTKKLLTPIYVMQTHIFRNVIEISLA